MICYKDKTFCPGGGCKKFDTCPRALTEEVRERAGKAGLPVAMFSDPRGLRCYEPQPTDPER